MTQLYEQVYNFFAQLEPGTPFLIAAVLIIIGIAFIVPSKKTKEWAQEHIVWLLVGAIIIIGALAFATDITSAFHFGTGLIMTTPLHL